MISRAKGHGKYATYELGPHASGKSWYVKLRPASHLGQLNEEANRSNRARNSLPTPEKSLVARVPGLSLLISKSLDGEPSHKHIDKLEPSDIIAGLSCALKLLRGAETKNFPFSKPIWLTEAGIERNVRHLSSNPSKHRQLHPDFASLSLSEIKSITNQAPSSKSDNLVHGDFCMPNILLKSCGGVSGIVDLGGLHIGDPNTDLAILSWTVRANMGEKWSSELLKLHNSSEDDSSIKHFRLAYDLGLRRENPWEWTKTNKLTDQIERLSSE